MARLLCALLGSHAAPKRVPLGWRCSRCDWPATDLDAFGGGWVSVNRLLFRRDRTVHLPEAVVIPMRGRRFRRTA